MGSLTLAPFEGAHNDDFMGTQDRLMKGGSWKTQRIVVILPAGKQIWPKVYLSHMGIIFPPNNMKANILATGFEVGEAYSEAIKGILQHPQLSEWEYVLTIEHDNTPPPDGVLKLLEAMEEHPEYCAISGLYYCKGPGGCAHIWGDIKDPVPNSRPQVPLGGEEVQECYGLSMGFALYRMGLFKDESLRKPWFKTQTEGGVATQDLYFWQDARSHGYRCAVHNGVRVGHYDHDGSQGGIPEFTW